MSDCDKRPSSITPCEFPLGNEDCPIGYLSTDCINYIGEDEVYSEVLAGDTLTVTINKVIEFAKKRVRQIYSNTCNIIENTTEDGTTYSIEVDISIDDDNQLIYGYDGKLYVPPYEGPLYIDTNSINLIKDTNNGNISAEIKYVQSTTVNLATTPMGLKADLSQQVLDRFAAIEQRLLDIENVI